jgi:subtilase family serine protease
VIGAQPDLYIAAVSAPASATRGVAFSITDRTANKGSANAVASRTAVYVADGDLTGVNCPASGTGTLLNSRAVPILVPSGSNVGSISVTIASSASAGTKTLIWMADYSNAVTTEGNEKNNTYCKKITVN